MFHREIIKHCTYKVCLKSFHTEIITRPSTDFSCKTEIYWLISFFCVNKVYEAVHKHTPRVVVLTGTWPVTTSSPPTFNNYAIRPLIRSSKTSPILLPTIRNRCTFCANKKVCVENPVLSIYISICIYNNINMTCTKASRF